MATRLGLRGKFPRLGLSTDNAAMIAAATFPKFLAGQFAGGILRRTLRWRWANHNLRCTA